MAKKSTYITRHRRRREGRTDYRLRLNLLKSKKPRLVVRKSANNITSQVVKYQDTGDHVIVSVNSTDIRKLGWKGHGGNVQAAYLVGLLCGHKAKKEKVGESVFDMGLYTSTKGSVLFAALKGAVDSGLKVTHSAEIMPPEEKISGKQTASYAGRLKKESPERYEKVFSGYLKAGLDPENLPQHFAEIKGKILK